MTCAAAACGWSSITWSCVWPSGWPAGGVGSAASSLPITPTFVLPYKRYAGPTLLHLAAGYVENDRQSYRKAASPGGRATCYQETPYSRGKEDWALHHSTIWCMLVWLGSQCAAMARGRLLIQQQHPASTCHRFVGAVAPHKFRSPQRQQALCRARQLLHLIAEWNRLFPEKFFPRFATKAEFW
jgi:hypothetical protein